MPDLLVKKHNCQFYVANDDYAGFWKNVNNNLWEIATFAAFDEFIDKRHCYIDIGAWIGPTVLYGTQLARECYAVEPDPVAFGKLEANVRLNGKFNSRIKLFNGCISDKSGIEYFGTQSSFGDSMSSLLFADREKAIEVPALTLEEYFDKYRIRDCNFIKMDIEGGEIKVLPQASKFLSRMKSTLYLSLHSKYFEDKERSANEITDALRVYTHLYTPFGQEMLFQDLFKDIKGEGRVSEIIATGNRWSAYRRKRYQVLLFLPRLRNKLRTVIRENFGGK